MDSDAVELCPLDLPLASYMVLLFAFSVTAIDTEMLSKFTFLAPGLQALSLLMESSPSIQKILQEVFWGWDLWLCLVGCICCRWPASHTLSSYGGGWTFRSLNGWEGNQWKKWLRQALLMSTKAAGGNGAERKDIYVVPKFHPSWILEISLSGKFHQGGKK